MSRWVRGIYNAAASFVLSGSLRAASGRTMDRKSEYLSKECDKSDQHVESGESSKSLGCTTPDSARTTSDGSRTSASSACSGTTCSSTAGTSACRSSSATSGKLKRNCVIADFNVLDPNAECSCPICRDYNEYTANIDSQREGTSFGVRLSNEPRHLKQTHAASADRVEQCTGIPTGVTV